MIQFNAQIYYLTHLKTIRFKKDFIATGGKIV